jgi:MinD-like ATPase involved in chromosome partitioning or flagellar assembly
MTVQIVRFKDGLDVICNIDYKDLSDKVELFNPMIFEVRNTNLVMQQWLPLAVIKGNSVMIDNREILCVMDPNDDFAEYYEETVRKTNEVLRKKEEISDDKEKIQEFLQSLIDLETSKDVIKH